MPRSRRPQPLPAIICSLTSCTRGVQRSFFSCVAASRYTWRHISMAESASSKRRLQSNAACKGCRKRKSRCDGARPRCSNCEIRDVQCEYASPSSTSKRPRPSRVAVVSTPSSTAREHNVDDGEQTYLGPSTTFNFVSDCSKRGPNGAQPAFQSHLSPLPGSDASARSTTTLQTIGAALDLPDRDLADRLVDAYFSHTHQLYPVLHEGTFRAEYESMWERSSSYQHHSGLSWHALLNVVFAHGLEPGGLLDDDDASAHTARFIQRSQDLIARHAFKTATLELVQSMLLLCFHLQNTAEIEQCWNLSGLTIRTATSLGVHLSLHQENFLPIERELRKRAWWGCYVLDQSISMQLGRTPCLGVNYGHVGLPLEIDDIYMTNDEIAPTQPSVIPSMVSFFIAVIRLSSIVSEMLEKLYLRDHTKYRDRTENALDPPYSRCHYILSTVIFLEGKLQSWWTQIPAHLKQYATGNERGRSSLQVQRVILRVKCVESRNGLENLERLTSERYLHVRLLLHRQTLLYFARNEIQDDFCRSIAIASTMKCVDCAHETISLIHSASAEQDIFSLSHSAQREFSSLSTRRKLKYSHWTD